MYYVGIDIAKYKHNCFIFTSEGEVVLESQKTKQVQKQPVFMERI